MIAFHPKFSRLRSDCSAHAAAHKHPLEWLRHNQAMCLVGLAWNVHPRWRLVLVGNRDEMHARPTAALAAWNGVPVLAGRDLRSGGTWMGLGPKGRAAVVTNVRAGLPKPFDGPSRGALPGDFLAGNSDAAVFAADIAAGASRYAPFNLVLADANTCVYVGNHPSRSPRTVPPGVHALSNGPFDAAWPKTLRLRGVLQNWTDSGSEALDPLWDALANVQTAPVAALPHTGVPVELEQRLSAAFVRGDEYGTRASTILLIDHDGCARIIERSFGPQGAFLGETTLDSSG